MPDSFFARQPILDGTKSVFGYELLFRNSLQNSYTSLNGEHATLDILSNAIFHTSFERMVGGKFGFVNFTRELLLSDVVHLFSPEHIIIEVLEDVVPDDAIVAACRKLKESNYRIALDDFVAGDLNNPLIPLADFIKVDFLQAKGPDRRLIAGRLLPLNINLLAEKVETDGDYRDGLELGYRLFQGYFFSKPLVQSGRRLESSQVSCVRLLQSVFKDQCDYSELNEIVSGDMSLSYRMLKLANSPYFGFRIEITSILHAITLMGCSGMKRFVSLIAIGTSSSNKPTELAIACLVRARMGEEIAPLIGFADRASALFLTGLFSLLDALLDCSMKEALAELPIEQEIKAALLGDGNILRNALDAITAYERGDWDQFKKAARLIHLQEDNFPAIYASAIEWATDIFQSM
jgi:c-di-GMP-related signal transduction protein